MADSFFYIFIFLFGLIIGSFLNCVIYRLEMGQGFFKGRSCCPHCKHKLGFLDLIPVLSFLWLRGKCRYCQKNISWQYPLVELVTGVLFVFVVFEIATMIAVSSFYWLTITCFLIVIFVYDLKHYIIPDKIIYPAIGVASILRFPISLLILEDIGNQSIGAALSAFGASAFFLAIVLISRGRWMGAGDVKLVFFMGLVLSWPNILAALFLAFFVGAIMGIGMIISGKKNLKSEVPFGPFLVMGTFTALFWGEAIINWYVQSFYHI